MTKNTQSTNKSEELTVKDFMTKDPEFVSPETTLKEVADKMAELNTGSLPVGSKDELSGFVTDRDIVVEAISEGKDPESTTIDKIMTDEVVACHQDDSLEEACDNMKENEVLRLVVKDENERIVGVITHGQIAKAAIEANDNSLCKKVAEVASYDKNAA
jgi:CBS domain-containing protein